MAKKNASNNKTILYTIIYTVLAVFVIALVLPFLGGLLSSINPSKAIQMAQQKKMENVGEETPDVIQDDSKPDFTNWKVVSDSRGFSIKIPNNWYATYSEGKVQQVQNWSPMNYPMKGGGLQGDMSKWDIYYSKKPFISMDQIIKEEYESAQANGDNLDIEAIEAAQSVGGYELYFIQGTSTLYGNQDVRISTIMAVIVDNAEYFSWYSLYSGNASDARILKDIVKSIN